MSGRATRSGTAAAPPVSAAFRAPLCALVGLAVLMSVAFPVYLMTGGARRLVCYVSDDAYYYFSVAANLAAGAGPTADRVTVTTGFHPLYGFLLALLHRLTAPSLDGFVHEAVALNAACSLLAGWFLYRAGRHAWGRIAGVAAALLWLAGPHSTQMIGMGLEGSVYAMMLSLFFWRLVVLLHPTADRARAGLWTGRCALLGLCLGLVWLARTDALALLPLLMIVMTASRQPLRPRVRFGGAVLTAVLALALLAPWWGYAWAHTGGIMQGSATVKSLWRGALAGDRAPAAELLVIGLIWSKYLVKCILKIPALKWVISAVPSLFRRGRGDRAPAGLLHLLWVFPAGLGLAYAVFLDRPRSWYYVPALVGLTLLAAGAVQRLWQATPGNHWQALARRHRSWIMWAVALESGLIFARDAIHGRSSQQIRGLEAARWVVRNVEPETRVGCWHSGIVQYYSPGRTVINLDGLANNEIVSVLRGEKTMNDYWDERGIEIILGGPRAKMGSYRREWDGKRLERWLPGIQRVVRTR